MTLAHLLYTNRWSCTMRKRLVFLLILSFSLLGSVTFEKTFGKEWNDHANAIIQTSDGGYLIAGSTVDSIDYTYTFFNMTKISKSGEEQWMLNGSSYLFTDIGYLYNVGNSVIETNDSGYVAAGSIDYQYFGWLHTDIYVVKTDRTGRILWNYQNFDSSQMFNVANQIIQTLDDGYILICEDGGFLGGFQYDIIIKLDSDGKEKWRKYYQVLNGKSVLQTIDKGFVFTATQEDESENTVPILVKADSLGNEIWRKKYNGLFSYGLGYSLKYALDGGYTIFGMSNQNNYGDLARLIKTDDNGEIVWEKYYGNSENADENTVGRSLNISTDGGYILAGYTENILTGLADAWLIKTDSEGNEIWKKMYGREGDDRIYSVQQTSDGGYILAGYTDSIGTGGKDMWIIKTDETGTEIESPFLPQITELYQNYPNPFNPATEISFDLQKEGYINLTIYNSKGELVRTLFEGLKGQGMHTINFDASGLNSGIYFYKLTVEDNTITRKMLFLK